MRVKTPPYHDPVFGDPAGALAESLGALYRRRVVGLDSISMSVRRGGSFIYLDSASAADIVLGIQVPVEWSRGMVSGDRVPLSVALHRALYDRFEDVHAVVSGAPPSTMALLELGLPLGPATSMMRKRNVPDLERHVLRNRKLNVGTIDEVIRRVRAATDHDSMGHMLMIIAGWGVSCAAPNLHEAVTHFDNVEVVARAEVVRLTAVVETR